MSAQEGYYFPDLLPALENLWHTDREQAGRLLSSCVADCKTRGLKLQLCILETAWKQLERGEGLDHIGEKPEWMKERERNGGVPRASVEAAGERVPEPARAEAPRPRKKRAFLGRRRG